jgi:hypothetical protein
MKNQQSIDNLRDKILKNATHLKVSDLKISDRVKIDASMLPPERVIALYTAENSDKRKRCKFYEYMPYKPLPNAVIYQVIKSNYS